MSDPEWRARLAVAFNGRAERAWKDGKLAAYLYWSRLTGWVLAKESVSQNPYNLVQLDIRARSGGSESSDYQNDRPAA